MHINSDSYNQEIKQSYLVTKVGVACMYLIKNEAIYIYI